MQARVPWTGSSVPPGSLVLVGRENPWNNPNYRYSLGIAKAIYVSPEGVPSLPPPQAITMYCFPLDLDIDLHKEP